MSGTHTYEAIIEDQNGSEIARDTFITNGELNGPTNVVFDTAGPATIRLDFNECLINTATERLG